MILDTSDSLFDKDASKHDEWLSFSDVSGVDLSGRNDVFIRDWSALFCDCSFFTKTINIER